MQTQPPVAMPPPPIPGPPIVQPPLQAAPTAFSLQLSTGRSIATFRGKKLMIRDVPELYPATADEAVAVVRHSPTDPTVLGLMNCSRSTWTAVMPDGSQRQIESGKALRLAVGTKILFGQTEALVQEADASATLFAQHGKKAGIGAGLLLLVVVLLIALTRGGGGNIAGLVAKCDQSMISIQTNDGSGSAFFISSDGKALTNAHVVGNNDTVTVEFHDGKTVQAKVIAKDAQLDVAMIKVDGGPYQPLDIDYGQQAKGTPVMALGFPKASLVGSLDNSSVAHGLVSRYLDRQKVDNVPGTFLQTDVSINHGNSGGPLISEDSGRVVGINSAVINLDQNHEPVQGMGFAIPMFEIKDKFLNKINQ